MTRKETLFQDSLFWITISALLCAIVALCFALNPKGHETISVMTVDIEKITDHRLHCRKRYDCRR